MAKVGHASLEISRGDMCKLKIVSQLFPSSCRSYLSSKKISVKDNSLEIKRFFRFLI